MSGRKSELRMPTGIYILAFLFLLAPLGNIFFSFAGSGIENWYYPDHFMELLGTIPAVDWIWLGGIFIAGLALLIPHKLSWLFAVFVLFSVLIMNTYRAFTLDEAMMSTDFIRMQILVSILVTFSVLIIAFYARYPYLDRRQNWISQTAHRFSAETPVLVHYGSKTFNGKTTSISTSGAEIYFVPAAEILKREAKIEVILPEIENLKIGSEVVDSTADLAKVKFLNLGWAERSRLEAWLKSRKA